MKPCFFLLALLTAAAAVPLLGEGSSEYSTGGQPPSYPSDPPPSTPAPAAEPLLRLNTSMHLAPVRGISADVGGKLVLTVSDDKTARLWDGESGEFLRVLRPPTGVGKVGMLYACALSADGGLAAVGGWSEEYNIIYFFNAATGDMVQRLSGLGNVINDLEFHSRRRPGGGPGRHRGHPRLAALLRRLPPGRQGQRLR